MRATASPVPGAHAVILPGLGPGSGGTANACVTDAGFCATQAGTPAGLDCLCESDRASYGGRTGTAPAP